MTGNTEVFVHQSLCIHYFGSCCCSGGLSLWLWWCFTCRTCLGIFQLRLHSNRWRRSQTLQIGNDSQNFLIGQINRRFGNCRHSGRIALHNVGIGLVEGFGKIFYSSVPFSSIGSLSTDIGQIRKSSWLISADSMTG